MSKQHNNSFNFIRAKIYGAKFSEEEINQIIQDIAAGNYCDAEIAAFLTACASRDLSEREMISLTKAMINIGNKITWDNQIIVDKHCVGGIPGNRTSPIIIPIVAAFGLTIPKTSSRAITSASGTADSMEVLTNIEFDIVNLKKIVAKENGCLAWGGLSSLSPADDVLVRVERILNLDSRGQLVASILSKKIAAGSNHILIDIPIGKTAKVSNMTMAYDIKNHLESIGEVLGVKIKVLFTDGSQPIGNGIGPALEARDVIAVLKNDKNAPQDLRDRAITLAGKILEFSSTIAKDEGQEIAEKILSSGQAWQKFQAICEAQGGMKTIPQARYTKQILAAKSGRIITIDNHHIATIAKLAGAPNEKSAGIDLAIKVDCEVVLGQTLFTIHANNPDALEMAVSYFANNPDMIQI